MSKWIHEEHTVQFHECDPSKTVYNRNYFIWFEKARFKIAELAKLNDYIAECELEQGELITFPVIEAQCKFLLPIPINTKLIINTKLERPKVAKLKFKHTIVDAVSNKEYAKAETIVGVVSSKRGLLLTLNPQVKSLIEDYLNS